MFGLGKDKTKVVVKTKKGNGPIRKIKYQIGVGTVMAVLSFLGVKEHVPEELYEPIAKFATEGVAVLIILVGYLTRPDAEDGVEEEA